MITQKSKKLLCFVLAVLMVASALPSVVMAAGDETTGKSELQDISEVFSSTPYDEYCKKYGDIPRGAKPITVNGVDYKKSETDAEVSVVTDYLGKSGKSLLVGDVGSVTYEFNVPADGKYAILIDYCSSSDKTNSIERVLYINGAVPFTEARYLLMKKTWVNTYAEGGRFEIDANGNELRPTTKVQHEWHSYSLTDSNGYYANPFEFYFQKGKNTISFEGVREPVVINKITLYPYEDKVSYEEYISGRSEAVAEPIYIAAETPSKTSDYTIYPIYDRKSAITEPQDSAKIRLNTIGSEKWQTVGQWVEYEFDVKSAGLYEIVFRYRQNELVGMYSSRKIMIDGVVPFEEANYAKFNYNGDWQVEAANNNADTFQFYLEPGKHTLRLEVTLGEMGDIIRRINAVMESINKDYLELIKLTGAAPDEYRDYRFGTVLPHVVEDIMLQSIEMYDILEYVEGMANLKSETSSTLESAAELLNKMATDEDEVAKNISALKDQVSTLGTWLNTAKTQPVEIDYILIQPASTKNPKAEANFFEAMWHEIMQFVASFYTDYNSLGGGEVDKESVTIDVWVTTGRDQAQIIRNLMDNDFSPTHDFNAELKLVSGGTLLPSVLAGVGPDVALPGTGVDPIQYAIRSAVYAINPEAYADMPDDDEETKEYNARMREIFSNYDEIAGRFTEAAMIPLTLYGKVYALPETQTWDMMFYRTDILAELGVEVPKTWDDLLALIPILQFNNMEIGLSQNYQMYMYQRGGELWAGDGMRINLDANSSLESFEIMCNMFTQYSLPLAYDFANRFKTGEMPICIQPYTSYNNIVIFANEIAGLWEFGPVPGYMKDDGTIDNTSMSTVTALTIMRGCEHMQEAWDFMCWYTDTKFQVDYSNELVAILGDCAKNATANIEALAELPWTSREYEQLMKQSDVTTAVPNYPGTYILARYTDFALKAAYNEGADPVQELLSYINAINKEISRKRTEFGLETLEIGQTLASKRLGQAGEAIAELDEGLRNSQAVQAVVSAIETEDSTIIRQAAAGLDTSNKALAQIVSYMNDAANALDTYE